MYRLLSGLYQHLTRKEEYNIIILGLDQSGKTTLLEKIKTIYNPNQPGLKPNQISQTIGQNIGKIIISSSYLQFIDLGGSKEIRSIWEKYFKDIDGLCWVLDSNDRIKNSFPSTSSSSTNNKPNHLNSSQNNKHENGFKNKGKGKLNEDLMVEEEEKEEKVIGESWIELKKVLEHPLILESKIPILILANKQDSLNLSSISSSSSTTTTTTKNTEEDRHETQDQNPMKVEEIKELFNRLVIESDRSEKSRSLGITEANVIGVSALNGNGIREAINWLFYRIATKSHSRKTLNSQLQHQLHQQQQPQPPSSNLNSNSSFSLGGIQTPLKYTPLSSTPMISRTNSYQN